VSVSIFERGESTVIANMQNTNTINSANQINVVHMSDTQIRTTRDSSTDNLDPFDAIS